MQISLQKSSILRLAFSPKLQAVRRPCFLQALCHLALYPIVTDICLVRPNLWCAQGASISVGPAAAHVARPLLEAIVAVAQRAAEVVLLAVRAAWPTLEAAMEPAAYAACLYLIGGRPFCR